MVYLFPLITLSGTVQQMAVGFDRENRDYTVVEAGGRLFRFLGLFVRRMIECVLDKSDDPGVIRLECRQVYLTGFILSLLNLVFLRSWVRQNIVIEKHRIIKRCLPYNTRTISKSQTLLARFHFFLEWKNKWN